MPISNTVLRNFTDAESEIIIGALTSLLEVKFFSKHVRNRTTDLVDRMDTIVSDEDRMKEMNNLSAIRAELLYLENESASMARAISDSNTQERLNEEPVE